MAGFHEQDQAVLELDRVRLIAHDWGALVGFQLCLNHPGRVQHLLALGVPHPYVRFQLNLLAVAWRLWFQVVMVTPRLAPRLLSSGKQRFARYLLRGFTYDQSAWTEDNFEIFVAQLREPARARAASALYRGFIMREALRIMAGRYRDTRLRTATRVLYGGEDPAIRAEFLGGHEDHADDLAVELVDGASHFVADERPHVVVERALQFFAQS